MNEIIDIAEENKNQVRTKTSFHNPLLQQLQLKKLTREEFSLFQRDLKNILLNLLAQITSSSLHIDMINLNSLSYIDDILEGASHQCDLLKEYCNFFSIFSGNIAPSYRYLQSISHKFKSFAENIKAMHLVYVSYEDNEKEMKELIFNETQSIIQSGKEYIQQSIENISHMDYDSIVQEPEVFMPNRSINETINFQKGDIEKKRIHIENTISNTYFINNYQEIFEIVINNLLTNAVKFTLPEGKIMIGIEKEDDKNITFFVQDSGIGIPPKVNVFKHGYTTPSTDEKKGTGLGLSECENFLKLINGSINYKSSPQGTVFSFTMLKIPSSLN